MKISSFYLSPTPNQNDIVHIDCVRNLCNNVLPKLNFDELLVIQSCLKNLKKVRKEELHAQKIDKQNQHIEQKKKEVQQLWYKTAYDSMQSINNRPRNEFHQLRQSFLELASKFDVWLKVQNYGDVSCVSCQKVRKECFILLPHEQHDELLICLGCHIYYKNILIKQFLDTKAEDIMSGFIVFAEKKRQEEWFTLASQYLRFNPTADIDTALRTTMIENYITRFVHIYRHECFEFDDCCVCHKNFSKSNQQFHIFYLTFSISFCQKCFFTKDVSICSWLIKPNLWNGFVKGYQSFVQFNSIEV